jgi:hypothetical protein
VRVVDLRPLDELQDDDDECGGSLLPTAEAHEATKQAPLLLSALAEELKLVQSEQFSRARARAGPHPDQASTLLPGATRKPGAGERGAAAACGVQVAEDHHDLLIDDASLWQEFGVRLPEDIKGPDKQERPPARALEERARSLLHQDAPVLPSSTALGAPGANDHGPSATDWDDIGEGWEVAEEGSTSGSGSVVHVAAGGNGSASAVGSASASVYIHACMGVFLCVCVCVL